MATVKVMQKIIVGNWKMYPTLGDSIVLAGEFKQAFEAIKGVEVVLAPPTAWLVSVHESWKHKLPHVSLASQNVWAEDQGAFTGEVSAYLLKDLITYAIIGHSERRSNNGETNELISKKIQAALKWGITPIVCVGETKKVLLADGTTDAHEWQKLSEQLLEALDGLSNEKKKEVIIAYEPVWAIGSSNPAKPEYTLAIIEKLRGVVTEKYGRELAYSLQFLYGGSVNASNAADYLRYSEINGLLVGSASVKAKEFIDICKQAAAVA